jgi:CheY-like chemotaxis protein
LLRFFASKSASRASTITQTAAATETASGSGHASSPKKILIVDDDAVILKTTALKLKSRGHTVVTATDGPTAIGAVRNQKPDLILLDISLPPNMGAVAWDGLLIMSWLRRLEEASQIPIIVITGSDPTQYKNRSLEAGAVAFFHKPIDHGNLLAVIERAVGQDAGSQQSAVLTFQI